MGKLLSSIVYSFSGHVKQIGLQGDKNYDNHIYTYEYIYIYFNTIINIAVRAERTARPLLGIAPVSLQRPSMTHAGHFPEQAQRHRVEAVVEADARFAIVQHNPANEAAARAIPEFT